MKRRSREYEVVRAACTAVGVEVATDPNRNKPPGRGWSLVTVAFAGNWVFHFWKRTRQRRPPCGCAIGSDGNVGVTCPTHYPKRLG